MKEETGAPDWTSTPLKKNKKIRSLVIARQQFAATAKEAEEHKKSLSSEILTILTKADVDKVRFDDFLVSIVTTERVTLNEGMLKAALVEGGMEIQQVEKLWKKCSSSWKTGYVKVTGPRE